MPTPVKYKHAKAGSIYFAESSQTARIVKIGFTAGSPQQRVKSLKSTPVYRNITTVIGVLPGIPFGLEHQLHRYFGNFRVQGELFRREGELDVFLSYIQDANNVKSATLWFTENRIRDIRLSQPRILVTGAVQDTERPRKWYIPPGDAQLTIEPTHGEMRFSSWGCEDFEVVSAGQPARVTIPAFVRTAEFELSYRECVLQAPWISEPQKYRRCPLQLLLERPCATEEDVNRYMHISDPRFGAVLDKMPKRWSEPDPV